ncbi:MAG: nuclease family protein [Ferruginibacter sp.]|nr:nuclease family protein [Ferruginibacter sp.]
MSFFVYILQSEKDGSFYKGFTGDPLVRLTQHNLGQTLTTRIKMPWRLVYVESFLEKRDALIREKKLKKYSVVKLMYLISHKQNIVHLFLQR